LIDDKEEKRTIEELLLERFDQCACLDAVISTPDRVTMPIIRHPPPDGRVFAEMMNKPEALLDEDK
jgi:hypothetical protein